MTIKLPHSLAEDQLNHINNSVEYDIEFSTKVPKHIQKREESRMLIDRMNSFQTVQLQQHYAELTEAKNRYLDELINAHVSQFLDRHIENNSTKYKHED